MTLLQQLEKFMADQNCDEQTFTAVEGTSPDESVEFNKYYNDLVVKGHITWTKHRSGITIFKTPRGKKVHGLGRTRAPFGEATEGQLTTAVQPEHILQYFEYGHLKPEMQAVSAPFGELANKIVDTLPRNPERTVALRKLLEAKDAAVRAFISKS